VQYEWDRKKAEANLKKHRVSFVEATTVFLDPLAVSFDDPDHSAGERRYITIGTSTAGRVLFVAIAERGEMVRIISARCATRREVHGYQEGKF
jgi:hypothetical protein